MFLIAGPDPYESRRWRSSCFPLHFSQGVFPLPIGTSPLSSLRSPGKVKRKILTGINPTIRNINVVVFKQFEVLIVAHSKGTYEDSFFRLGARGSTNAFNNSKSNQRARRRWPWTRLECHLKGRLLDHLGVECVGDQQC